MKVRITHTSEIRRNDQQVWQEVGEECVILDLRDGFYYGLDEVGSRVWALIQTPITVEAIRDLLVAEYEVDPVCCELDLLQLLHNMAALGLIQVTEGHA
jgi:hypothetical protein